MDLTADHRGPNPKQTPQTLNLSPWSALVRVPAHCSLNTTGIATAAGKPASTPTAGRSPPAFWPMTRRSQRDQHYRLGIPPGKDCAAPLVPPPGVFFQALYSWAMAWRPP